MELTIAQALQQGVTAHKEGKLQEAERLYRAILLSQPAHPDANHNLGLIAASINKADAALSLFKIALEANPKIEQFWLSYIDALIKEKQFESAEQVIEQAKKQGISGGKFKALEAQLILTNQVNEPKLVVKNKSQPLSGKRKKLAEDKKKKAEKKYLKSINPSETEINTLLQNCQDGQYGDAEKLAKSITKKFPESQFGWLILGTLLQVTGRIPESLFACQKSVQLAPQDADAHDKLGNALKELGKLDEAEASYTQAIALKPNYAPAHCNLGITLNDLGRLHEAEASLRQAIALKPDFPEASNTLGVTLQKLGRLDEAFSAFIQAINLNPDYASAYINLSLAIKSTKFNSSNRKLYPPLIQLLTNGNFTHPKDVAYGILSLLKHDPLIKDLLPEKNNTMSLKEAIFIIGSLNELTLLHHLMRVCPLPDIQLEGFFVTMRSFLLTNLNNIEASPELIYFLSTLSLHCFTNEYVYIEKDEETVLVESLEVQITHAIAKSEQPEAIKILCLASYRPLHQYDWCKKLEALDHLEEVKSRLIEEPHLERVIAAGIPMLGEISDEVSLKVKAQYEENPYPRWVRLGINIKAKSIAAVCDDAKLRLYSESIKDALAPAILIAGCGTGRHSIGTASRFTGCQVTAVDLSLASLAYAKRKTAALGITNLKYLQADILKLDQLEQEFDIIESAGVLHHMNEPMAGWTVLTDLLKPGGLMKIGLYSELARQDIVEVRKEITLLRVGTNKTDIKEFRRSLAESHDENHRLIITSGDFFSLSTLRDLLFHEQEHRFTLPQIKNCLDELGLKFCGFENTDAISNFRELHGKEADIYDLALWHQYEASYPQTFVEMYQFWCQKL
jgi:tetratricopeptide (TPR) repeat protein